jgi:hypothetical protein
LAERSIPSHFLPKARDTYGTVLQIFFQKFSVTSSVADQEPDPHHFGKLDPDPNQSGKLDPDSYQSEKQDPDPHQSEEVDVL